VNATELAALIVAIASVVGVVLLGLALSSITKTLRAVRETTEILRTETVPAMEELASTARTANLELQRVDTLIDSAESISGTVDSASRLAYLAFSNPVIKAVAFGAGTSHALRRLRRARED
jgi:uncharacterized protein YoxC